jgi:hypothetical protein
MSYHISTLWITRHSDATPELLAAWDQFSIDGNPGGFTKACEDALAAVGGDVRDRAYLTLIVPEEPIFDALYPPDVPAIKVMVGAEETPA